MWLCKPGGDEHVSLVNFWENYLAKHLPRCKSVELNRKRVFIFPSRAGVYYLCLCVALLIVAINYENNLGYAFSFLMISVFVVCILHTYRNLSGLVIDAQQAIPCFVGESAEFRVKLRRRNNQNYFNLQFIWPNADPVAVDLFDRDELSLKIYVKTESRGLLRPGRLLLQTYYPLGILRAWSFLSLDLEALVYPQPVKTSIPPTLYQHVNSGDGSPRSGGDGAEDFQALSNYQPGASLKRIAWKQFAAGQGLFVKQFDDPATGQLWLDWYQLAHDDVESRLSKLCYLAVEFHRAGHDYGLRLPSVTIEPRKGANHFRQILKSLALYGL